MKKGNIELAKSQQSIDMMRICDSKRLKRDVCGEYQFCKHCNKAQTYCCAIAREKWEEENK